MTSHQPLLAGVGRIEKGERSERHEGHVSEPGTIRSGGRPPSHPSSIIASAVLTQE